MWTKDYLVRGFIRRRDKRRPAAHYEDEWQALYRVEGARRRLKLARKEAEDIRKAVLAWDLHVVRNRIAAAAAAAAQRERDAAAYSQRQVEAAERKSLQEDMIERYIAEHRRKATATRVPAWASWAWVQGQTQREVGRQLGSSATAIGEWTLSYAVAHCPQGVRNEGYGTYFAADKRQILKDLFHDKPEPPRPECWRSLEPARPPSQVAPELRWLSGADAKQQRAISRRRHIWAWNRHLEGKSCAEIGEGLGVGSWRVGQMLAHEERRRQNFSKTRWVWYLTRKNLGRPIDMGGPRDQWLEYKPGDAL